MRIAFVIPEFHKRGGTERFIASVAEVLAARGHNITVFASVKDPSVLPGATWHRVPLIRRPHLVRFLSFLFAQTAVRVLKGERFDVVHSTGSDVLRPTVAMLECCATSFAEVLERNLDAPVADTVSRRFRRWVNSVTYRAIAAIEGYVVRTGARHVMACSRTLAQEVRQHYGPARDIEPVYNGVDLQEFRPSSVDPGGLREELGLPRTGPTVLFVGYNWERKGLPVLVDALAIVRERLPDLRPRLVIVGGTGPRSYIPRIRAKLGDDVTLLGARSDMAKVYQACDVYVLPTQQEPFGMPVLEAMACAVPVIVSRCAGVAEIVKHGHDGLILEDHRNPRELAAKLENLLLDADLRRRLGAEARRTCLRYSWEEVAQQVEQAYRRALNGRHSG